MTRYKRQDEDRLIQYKMIVRDRNGQILDNIMEIDPDAPEGELNAKRIVSLNPLIIDNAYIPDATVEIDGVMNPKGEHLETIRNTIKANVSAEARAGLINDIMKEKEKAKEK